MQKISDFAAGRGLATGTVRKYIQRNKELFAGHTKIEDKFLYVDEEGLRLLEEKYELPSPVQIIENPETMRRLDESQKLLQESQKMVLMQQQQIMELSQKEIEYRSIQFKLDLAAVEAEKREKTLSDQADQIAMQAEEIKEKQEIIASKDAELAELRQKLEEEKSKSWLSKLFNR